MRAAWGWLALCACGAPAWMKQGSTPPISILDAPPAAGATYVATVSPGDFGHPGPGVALERGAFQCRRLVDVIGRDSGSHIEESEPYREAKQTCDPAIAELLVKASGVLFVVDPAGPHWLDAAQTLAAARPIDSPAKALLAVWLTRRYGLDWYDGHYGYGGPENGIVRKVSGGYEVVGSTSEKHGNCSGRERHVSVTSYRILLFVDSNGTVVEREKDVSNRDDVADPCHPL